MCKSCTKGPPRRRNPPFSSIGALRKPFIACRILCHPLNRGLLFLGGQILQVILSRLDAGVPENLLQLVDRPTPLPQELDREQVAQIVEAEPAELPALPCRLLCLPPDR